MIASWHGVFNEYFIFMLRFLLVNSITPGLCQPRLVARREVPGVWFLEFGQIKSASIYIGDVMYTEADSRFIQLS
jgi:hypothetical protein